MLGGSTLSKRTTVPESLSLFSAEVVAALEDLAGRVARLASPSGPRVIIVPGLPGSRLGRPPRDTIWFDPLAIRAGQFVDLRADTPGVTQLGLFEELYLRLMLRLREEGYTVELFPYDWRRSVPAVGADLSARIRAGGREVHLVAHSFGALVARAAAAAGTPGLGKVIMLAPSNQGLFAMVQAIRGSHWALHFASAIDGKRSAVNLAAQVLSTWPSVAMGLPVTLRPGDLDLFDLRQWPTEGLRPDPRFLREAAHFQRSISGHPASPARCFIIAGYGQPTVERVMLQGGLFRYHTSNKGDGFVTIDRAALDGHPVYYVRATHIGIANHSPVIEAVYDLLENGTTDRLERTPPANMGAPTPMPSSWFDEGDPVEPPFGGHRGGEVTRADLHALLDEVLGFVHPVPE
jgi:hypothetical protein